MPLMTIRFVYASETSPVTLRNDDRLSAFENKVLRSAFKHKKDGTTA
jgi:hypothetical protein